MQNRAIRAWGATLNLRPREDLKKALKQMDCSQTPVVTQRGPRSRKGATPSGTGRATTWRSRERRAAGETKQNKTKQSRSEHHSVSCCLRSELLMATSQELRNVGSCGAKTGFARPPRPRCARLCRRAADIRIITPIIIMVAGLLARLACH